MLIAGLDRQPDLPAMIASLRALLAQIDAGHITTGAAIRQRIVGAVLALELVDAGDDADAMVERWLLG
jgi:hypothetical protein